MTEPSHGGRSFAQDPATRAAATRALLGLLRAEQSENWRGVGVLVEDYLKEHPGLPADAEGLLELIYHEVLLREASGEVASLEEYLQRFPQFASQLRPLFEVHGAIEGGHVMQSTASGCQGPVSPAAPPTVPGFHLLGELGRGGMAVVYKGSQLSLKRLVALKMILGGSHAGPQELGRFRAEAEALARLQHPNIVQIYEVGEQEGRPYFSLEYVEGGTLAQKLTEGPLPLRQSAQLVQTLARAIHAAHQLGIVHRDLKPSNILLTPQGQPKITDFGLAKRLDQQSANTHTGDIMGTPSYMAPEQAAGRSRAAGPASDVYALGTILYELLAGRPPFRGHSQMDTLDQVRFKEPEPPVKWNPKLPRDLQTICLTCLQKEPWKRYASAEALAEDLRAFLAGEPIQARTASAWEKLVKCTQRWPALTLLAGICVVAAVGLLVGGLWYSAFTVSAIAVLSLLIGGGWYNGRLQAALRDSKQHHALAERHVERLHLVLENTRRLISAPDLDALLHLISEITTCLANAERCTIYLVDADKREVWSKVALGDGVGEIRLPVGVGIAGAVAASGDPINLSDAYADFRFNPEIDRRTGYTTRNLLTFPMTDQNGRILGVFQVLNKRTGPFVAEDVELLALLTESAAVAVAAAEMGRKWSVQQTPIPPPAVG